MLIDDVFGKTPESGSVPEASASLPDAPSGPVTIIYTSGTSGDAKGVVLTADNITYMLGCTSARLASLMQGGDPPGLVYRYLPFAFGASRIALYTYLLRGSVVRLNTDLTKIASELPGVSADYFLNVPALLERMRKAVDAELTKKGGLILSLYNRGQVSWQKKQAGTDGVADSIWLSLANTIVFRAIRKKMVGPNLKALISGSAPLAVETQLYFMMMGIPVLQVYGLTETTGICTMDDPARGPGQGWSSDPWHRNEIR